MVSNETAGAIIKAVEAVNKAAYLAATEVVENLALGQTIDAHSSVAENLAEVNAIMTKVLGVVCTNQSVIRPSKKRSRAKKTELGGTEYLTDNDSKLLQSLRAEIPRSPERRFTISYMSKMSGIALGSVHRSLNRLIEKRKILPLEDPKGSSFVGRVYSVV